MEVASSKRPRELEKPDRRKLTEEEFREFVEKTVAKKVKRIFKGLTEEGVQAGKREIDRSISK
jgi:hypothetical protein